MRTSITVPAGIGPDLAVPAQVTGKTLRLINFSASAFDSSGQPVTLSAANLPPGATFSDAGFTWTPGADMAGTYVVTITATNGAQAATTKNVTIVVKPRSPAVTGIFNAANPAQGQLAAKLASSGSSPCSPGSYVTLVGADLTPQDPQISSLVPMPTNLAGLQVLVNGDPTPLSYASDSLVNFQCPMLGPGATLAIQVRSGDGALTNSVQTTMLEVAPALYSIDSSGQGQGAILIASTNQLAMVARDNIPSRPAQPGEYVVIYANGLGVTDKPIAAGEAAPSDPLISVVHPIKIVIGGAELDPAFAGLTPGSVGLDQVNVQLPADIRTGDNVPVFLKVTLSDGSTVTSNQVTLAIQRP
jgi:uncharacterized protein (TIGR03437 family)